MLDLFRPAACAVTALAGAYGIARFVETPVREAFARAAKNVAEFALPYSGSPISEQFYDFSARCIGAASGSAVGLSAGILILNALHKLTGYERNIDRYVQSAESVLMLCAASGVIGFGAQGLASLASATAPAGVAGEIGGVAGALTLMAFSKSAVSAFLLPMGRIYAPRSRRQTPHP